MTVDLVSDIHITPLVTVYSPYSC